MFRGLLVALAITLTAGALHSQPADMGYTPVAPLAALHAALQSHLKQYGEWVNDGDFASASATAREVIALARLYARQGSEPAFLKRTGELAEACGQLPIAAAAKNAAACQRTLDQCQRILGELGQAGRPPAPVKDFKPPAGTKTWMLLMDAAYADAKYARTPAQLGLLAFALAEEANASAYLRGDAAWRKHSFDVRDAALQVARQSDDLPTAKKLLKEVYNRCETCHQRYQK